ncbi:hypothetical protein BT96DRAFT_990346 [Gymnopus androsaceus JB14]|uniref:Uncharacterized protein n=1 Tax=Gymnopus androsaceus JB14 TaxID=1447944 RepID=A0A6A4I3D8_9AGAR|nr:hypothetical protein BT96DRAFT_990346 [Gymnopus androsaceus JB14]
MSSGGPYTAPSISKAHAVLYNTCTTVQTHLTAWLPWVVMFGLHLHLGARHLGYIGSRSILCTGSHTLPAPAPPPCINPHPGSIQEVRFIPWKVMPSKLTVVHSTTVNSHFGTARPLKRDWMDRVTVQQFHEQDLQEIGDSQFPDQGIEFNIDGYAIDKCLDGGKDPLSKLQFGIARPSKRDWMNQVAVQQLCE